MKIPKVCLSDGFQIWVQFQVKSDAVLLSVEIDRYFKTEFAQAYKDLPFFLSLLAIGETQAVLF